MREARMRSRPCRAVLRRRQNLQRQTKPRKGSLELPRPLTFRQAAWGYMFRMMTDDEEKELKQELLMVDLDLRRKQSFWETPRNIALLLAATAAIAGAVGFKIGQ